MFSRDVNERILSFSARAQSETNRRAMNFKSGDRVAVGDHVVGDQPHAAETRVRPIQPGDSAVALQPDAAVFDRHAIELDQTPQ